MGRPPLSKEKTQEVTLHLIKTTQNLILQEGLSAVTIRKVAASADVNSAILYKYFKDLDELLLFACLDLFREYVSDLAKPQSAAADSDPKEYFIYKWELFSRIAFRYPEPMYQLFFSKHSYRLGEVIRSYYTLFAEDLSSMQDYLDEVVQSANLQDRNITVLQEIMGPDYPMEKIQLINDLSIACLNMLLREIMSDGSTLTPEAATERMLNACRLLIGL